MIKKYRTKPYSLLCYEALFRRLKKPYRLNKTLQEDYLSFLSGFRGEKNADYTLSIFPHKNSQIYQDLRLQNKQFNFQIDSLLITQSFILILEIKNLKGEVEYNVTSQQLIQNDGVKRKGYKSPILQAETQKMHLTTWLQRINFPPIPIETIAVISNPSTILNNNGNQQLIHLESLASQIAFLHAKYPKKILDQHMLKKLSRHLLKDNQPHKPDLIKQYKISEELLVEGIPCPACETSPMLRSRGKWMCPNCLHYDSKAHVQPILDYFLLYKNRISNRELRKYLQIESPRSAYLILQSMNLKFTGKNHGRVYHSPNLEQFPQDSNVPIEQKSIFQI